MARLAVTNREGPDPKEPTQKRHSYLGYAEGAFNNAEH
jgi:transposase